MPLELGPDEVMTGSPAVFVRGARIQWEAVYEEAAGPGVGRSASSAHAASSGPTAAADTGKGETKREKSGTAGRRVTKVVLRSPVVVAPMPAAGGASGDPGKVAGGAAPSGTHSGSSGSTAPSGSKVPSNPVAVGGSVWDPQLPQDREAQYFTGGLYVKVRIALHAVCSFAAHLFYEPFWASCFHKRLQRVVV